MASETQITDIDIKALSALTITGFALYGAYKFVELWSPVVSIKRWLQNDPNNGIIYMFDDKINNTSVFDTENTNYYKNLIIRVPKNIQIKLILSTSGGYTNNCSILLNCLREHSAGYVAYIYDHAMSSGTMIALGAKQIVMSRYSYLTKIDPTWNNINTLHAKKIINQNLNATNQALSELHVCNQVHYSIECEVAKIIKSQFSSQMYDKIISKLIYSELIHTYSFYFDDCKNLDLPIRYPEAHELRFFNSY